MIIHMDLKERIDRHYAEQLVAPTQLRQDALLMRFSSGLTLELRFAAADAYAMAWQWGDAQLRIDTAPLHPGLATFPNHVHGISGLVRADPITQPGKEPWDNTRAVIDALLADPLLGTA